MGALAIGSGAVMGSGAFTDGDASIIRGTEVNVISEPDVPDDAVDIILDVGNNSSQVAVASSLNTSGITSNYTDPTTLYPTSGNGGDYDHYSPADGDVSVVSNDVGIVFGRDDADMMPYGETSFPDLFTLTTNNTGNFTLDFDLAGNADFVFKVEGTNIITNTYSTSISDGSTNLTAAVDPSDSQTTSQIDQLTISISN